jgi:hypothetical protein
VPFFFSFPFRLLSPKGNASDLPSVPALYSALDPASEQFHFVPGRRQIIQTVYLPAAAYKRTSELHHEVLYFLSLLMPLCLSPDEFDLKTICRCRFRQMANE